MLYSFFPALASFHTAQVDGPALCQLRQCLKPSKKGGGLIIKHAPSLIPAVRRGDRLEPACEGLPDLIHGETLASLGVDSAKVLLKRINIIVNNS